MASGRALIVAETGASHRGSYARALALIDAAKRAGVDAIKFAAFVPDEMTVESDQPPFLITQGPWAGRTLHSLYVESALPYQMFPDLITATKAVGLDFILSIYHPNTVPWAVQWGCKGIKISSFELRYRDLLEAVAQEPSFKTVILSTGGATEQEIDAAVQVLALKRLALLHCISEYPAPAKDMNLRTMVNMQERLNLPVGLSDHTTGLTAPVTAVALGAVMVEKHIKLDDDSLDSSFAVFPDRFGAMVHACRLAEDMMGEISYGQPKTYHRKQVDGRMVRVVHQGACDTDDTQE